MPRRGGRQVTGPSPERVNSAPGPGKRAKLLDETRKYVIDEQELAWWVSGVVGFHVSDITYKRGTFEITVTTGKIERVLVTQDSSRTSSRPVSEIVVTERAEVVDDDQGSAIRGPSIVDEDPEEGVVGKADAVPAIARRDGGLRERLSKHVRSRREIMLEAQKAGRPAPESKITHLSDDDADPVPSQLPLR